MKVIKPKTAPKPREFFSAPVLLAVVLATLFWKSFLPNYVHFSNDGPLGQQNTAWSQLPAAYTGTWRDLNDLGGNAGSSSLDLTTLIHWTLGPVGYAKFLAPAALFILGLGAWTFFRALKFSPLAAVLGALAAMLNSAYFGNACWGVASGEIALGMIFFALALVIANNTETPPLIRWTRLALAGLCVGVNIMEAADIGALYSVLIAAFVFFKSFTDAGGNIFARIVRGVGSAAMVAVFAGFIAFQTVTSLVESQIQGIAGISQDAETKAAQWDPASQWSLPKKETLGLIVPGLFGYKMDTPNNMMPALQDAYRGGVYWGGKGRDPAIDRFFDSGGTGSPPSNYMRQSGGGDYCGILVGLVAAWTIAQSFRRKDSLFTDSQKKIIWFWTAVMFVSLVFAWGRFAPFDFFKNTIYALPYSSTVRNPVKFIVLFCLALVILFGYGIQALSRRHLDDRAAAKSSGLTTQLKNWWAKADGFDRKWTLASAGILGASVLGWLFYAAQKPSLVHYLQKVGFPDENFAREIATFSIGQAGWFLLLFASAIALLTLAIAGCFAGPRAQLGGLLLGAFLVMDLGRANLPYIIHWDYKQKYDIDPNDSTKSTNPIINFLRDKPYEHRVAGLPFHAPQGLELFDELYKIEWMQHHFPYYNIQCLDIIQLPRMPEDLKAYLEALSPRGTMETAPLIARRWELTNTRYLLGPAGYLEVMNQQLDPAQHRFRIVQRFGIALKPGVAEFHQRLEELTAYPNDNGDYALFEFTGALPRVKLYSNWQVNTNDDTTLKTLASTNFDPWQTVLVSMPLPVAAATNQNAGLVEFKSYAPKQLVFAANAVAPSVLLLNDKYDPHWRVTVDGKLASLLRCNFLMRGVYLAPGTHTVQFQFKLPDSLMYVTLTAITIGILLCGFLIVSNRHKAEPR
ncbi:MAG: hypothetical protein ABSG80_04205 [Verrucomicrobiota bacterium]|jgi:hypothetical protein